MIDNYSYYFLRLYLTSKVVDTNHSNYVLSLQPSTYTGWATYEIFNSNDATNNDCILEFVRKNDCKYGKTRVAWWNSLGGWDYLNCYGSTHTSEQYERYQYRTYGDNAFDVSTVNAYAVNPSDRMVSGGRTMRKRMLQTHTGFISESYNVVIEDLLQSPKVLVYHENTWQPAKVLTSSMDYKDSVIDKTIDYAFQFELAVPLNAIG